MTTFQIPYKIIYMYKNFTERYHSILSSEKPDFLSKYLSIPILTRLKGVGLLCGTDWTPFFSNNFYYSRFDHSVGVALIAWHFTHDKAQTIAGLLHDVSTPAFSHVSDFRKGDSLTQTATEEDNGSMLASSKELLACLEQDGLTLDQVDDYHKYPVCDNEVPFLSADRLEYMFPSGAALSGTWSLTDSFSLDEIKMMYDDLVLCRNEDGFPEPGFKTLSIAEAYTKRTTDIGLFLQKNEDKMAMQFPAEILNIAVELDLLQERDFFDLSEKEIIEKLDDVLKQNPDAKLADSLSDDCNQNENQLRTDINSKSGSPNENNISLWPTSIEKFCVLYRTYRSFNKITRSKIPLENHYCVNLKVKQRYINPLVVTEDKKSGDLYTAARVTALSKKTKIMIDEFLSFDENCFGCVEVK